MKSLYTKDKFDLNRGKVPFTESTEAPIPTRNVYKLFQDSGQDLFRHGLQQLTPVPVGNGDYTFSGNDTTRFDQFDTLGTLGQRYGNGLTDQLYREDPVMFGFDLIIKTNQSPLFNGQVDDFLTQFNGIPEISSRGSIYSEFKKRFFSFFRPDFLSTPDLLEDEDNPTKSRFYYYLKKVGGLENLIEANKSDKSKSFVNYRTDLIKLTFNEDVSLRVGTLAYLYKLLSWSRINGKEIMPGNLLRFDCDIIVTEVRNFSIIRKNGATIEELRDNMNRYIYSLYECQLFFDKMPHNSDISLGDAPSAYQDAYEVSFNYKFATNRMDFFNYDTQKYVPMNNDRIYPFVFNSIDGYIDDNLNTSSDNGTIEKEISNSELKLISVQGQDQVSGTQSSDLDNAKEDDKKSRESRFSVRNSTPEKFASAADINAPIYSKKTANSTISTTKANKSGTPEDIKFINNPVSAFIPSKQSNSYRLWKRLANIGINQINQQSISRARILNKALDKARNSIGLGRMSAPTNIYSSSNNQLQNGVTNAVRDFLGNSFNNLINGG